MIVKSKKGKEYQYDYKAVLVREEDHEHLRQLSIKERKPITRIMGEMIKFYKDNN